MDSDNVVWMVLFGGLAVFTVVNSCGNARTEQAAIAKGLCQDSRGRWSKLCECPPNPAVGGPEK